MSQSTRKLRHRFTAQENIVVNMPAVYDSVQVTVMMDADVNVNTQLTVEGLWNDCGNDTSGGDQEEFCAALGVLSNLKLADLDAVKKARLVEFNEDVVLKTKTVLIDSKFPMLRITCDGALPGGKGVWVWIDTFKQHDTVRDGRYPLYDRTAGAVGGTGVVYGETVNTGLTE